MKMITLHINTVSNTLYWTTQLYCGSAFEESHDMSHDMSHDVCCRTSGRQSWVTGLTSFSPWLFSRSASHASSNYLYPFLHHNDWPISQKYQLLWFF